MWVATPATSVSNFDHINRVIDNAFNDSHGIAANLKRHNVRPRLPGLDKTTAFRSSFFMGSPVNFRVDVDNSSRGTCGLLT